MRSQEPHFRQIRDREKHLTNNPTADPSSPQAPSKPLPKAPAISVLSKQTTQRTSFQDRRSRQTSSGTSDDKSVSYKGEREGQEAQMSVFGDRTKGLKNQKSAPDLKPKPDESDRPDLNGSSELASLGFGPGLGLGRMMETNSSRPVIVQRHTTQHGSGSSANLPDSRMSFPREHSALVLTVPLQDQAPLPKKRLSFSLRNKNKDRQVAVQLNAASPKAPGDTLKSVLSPRMMSIPGSTGAPASIVSPALSASHGSPENGPFSKTFKSSPRTVSPSSGRPTPTSATTAKPPPKYAGHNPTFTSHPPNMKMATSPPLKQGQTLEASAGPLEVPNLRAVPDLDSGNTSYESSLGEPGPEVSATEEGDDDTQETPIAELDSGNSVTNAPVELEAAVPSSSQPVVFELEAPQHSRPAAPNTGAKMSPRPPTVGATIQSHSDFFKLPPQEAGDHPGERIQFEGQMTRASQPFVAKDRPQTALLHRSFQLPTADLSNTSGLLGQETEESCTAVRHRSFQLPTQGQSNGTNLTSPASDHSQNPTYTSSFELPADAVSQTTSLNPVVDDSRKSRQHRSFQLPPSDGPHADLLQADETVNGDPGDLPRDDRQTLPSRMSASEARPRLKRLSPKHHLQLIDIISHTPPGSPIHERPTSSASFQSAANSARLNSYRASIDLAPPEEAPAPPPPGGRVMVNQDYATAGAFEGEKRAKRTSGASMKGLKKMLSGRSASHSRTGSVRVVELSEGRMSGGGVHDNVDLMTSGGSDVLWFKGMGRDGVWVSGS